jgi:para-nitrobenzyl esterase
MIPPFSKRRRTVGRYGLRQRLMITLLAALTAGHGAFAAQTTRRVQIKAPAGTFIGLGGPVNRFTGIRYAAAPTGIGRWRAPRSLPQRTESIDATRYGPDCIEKPNPVADSRAPGQSEDCLTLNVWTPRLDRHARLPVMVWIHGGGFIGGSAAYPYYDGAAFARRGVVFVSVNYRLGVFGFFAHPVLTRESGASPTANWALMDQLAAFRWVRQNISVFGGDPGNVTAMGQSAGANAISLLIAAGAHRGLFQKAILESPALLRPLQTLDVAEAASVERVGLDIVAARALPSSTLLQLNDSYPALVSRLARPGALGPVLDGRLLRSAEASGYASPRLQALPMLIGSNADEGRALALNTRVSTRAEYQRFIEQNFGAASPRVEQAYAVSNDADVPRAVSSVIMDRLIGDAIPTIARQLVLRGAPVYLYRFTYEGAGGLPPTHSDELPYVFGHLDELGRSATHRDRRVSELLQTAWVQFAQTGNPNRLHHLGWLRYSLVEPAVATINDRLTMTPIRRLVQPALAR